MTTRPDNYESKRDEYLKEREFLENLMNSRFNFLLVVYGIVIAGAVAASSVKVAYFLLAVGLFTCGSLALATYRAYTVVMPIVALLKADSSTPLAWASAQADKHHWISVTANRVIGSLMPMFCVVTIILALIGLYVGWWAPASK